jgi:hypothetical protein
MFEEVDSLGVSQGQGRGFAQVFDSTYNPVFKEEGNRLLAEQKAGKKEIDKQLESIDGSVWFRDADLVKTELGNLYQYVQDNNRNILKGNTTEAIEYKKKINDIKTIVANAKLAEQQTAKFVYALETGGEKYDREESSKTIQSFLDAPGDYDFSKLQLIPSFSMASYEKKFMQPEVSKLINTITQSSSKDKFGNYNYDQVEKTSKQAMDNWAERMWNDGNNKMKQSYGSLDEFKNAVYDYGNLELKKNVKTPYIDPNQKTQQKFDLKINNVVEDDISVPYGEIGSPNKIFQKSRSIAVQETAGNFTENVTLSSGELKKMRAIPLTIFGKYKGTDGKIADDYFDRDFWELEDQGGKEFEPKKVKSLAVLRPKLDSNGNPIDKVNFRKNESGEIEMNAETTKGEKRWIPIENISISANDVKKGKFRGITLNDENSLWEPYLIGNYKKELGDKQSSFDVAIPYYEYKGFVGANPKGGNDIKNFEAVINEKNPEVLQEKTFSRGSEIAGIKRQSSGEKKQKLSDELVSKTKEGNRFLKRDEYINKNYDKTTLGVYDKYLKKSNKAVSVAPLREMKDYSLEQIEEYNEYLDTVKKIPVSIKKYFE